MEYVHVKNLEKYHPNYKDRNLIWCKTYFTMVNSEPEFEMLTETDKWRFIAFVMLEIQMKKPVPIDDEYLKRKGFNLEERPISLTLKMLHNFIDCVTNPVHNFEPSVPYIREEKIRKDNVTETLKPKKYLPDLETALAFFPDKIMGANFFDYYQSNGWRVGKMPMKDWEAAARRWIRVNTKGAVKSGIPSKKLVL